MRADLAPILADSRTALAAWRIWLYLGVRDVRSRFRRSVVGPFWIFVNLGLNVATIGFIYGELLGQDLHEFLPSLTAGLVLWTYLSASLVEGTSTFLAAEPLLKNLALPKQIHVLRVVVSLTITALIGLTNVAVVMLVLRTPVGWGTLYFVPGLVVLVAIVTGHVWAAAYVGVRVRDVGYATASILSVLFYATPILFRAEDLAERHLELVYLCNPFYHLVELVRYPLLHAAPAPTIVYVACGAHLVLGWSSAFFLARRLDRDLAYLL